VGRFFFRFFFFILGVRVGPGLFRSGTGGRSIFFFPSPGRPGDRQTGHPSCLPHFFLFFLDLVKGLHFQFSFLAGPGREAHGVLSPPFLASCGLRFFFFLPGCPGEHPPLSCLLTGAEPSHPFFFFFFPWWWQGTHFCEKPVKGFFFFPPPGGREGGTGSPPFFFFGQVRALFL